MNDYINELHMTLSACETVCAVDRTHLLPEATNDTIKTDHHSPANA